MPSTMSATLPIFLMGGIGLAVFLTVGNCNKATLGTFGQNKYTQIFAKW